MIQIIDYRNARYQGQTYHGQPDGLGIFIDLNNIFCLAEWREGTIHGKCVLIFGDSKIFYGQIKNEIPLGICTYHLRDKCQIFCNFQKSNYQYHKYDSFSQPRKNNDFVALLPTFKMIIKVQGQNQQHLEIKQQQIFNQGDYQNLKRILQQMLKVKLENEQIDQYLSLEKFLYKNFGLKKEYQSIIDIFQIKRSQKAIEMFLTLKPQKNQSSSSLGIKILNCMQNLTNLHNDGNTYIVQSLGFYSKQGILQFGQKTIKTLIKGSIKQQADYSNISTIIRYEQNQRPKECALNRMKLFKQSIYYNNEYMSIKYLIALQSECLNINFNIKEIQTKKYAQLVLQNPKKLTFEQKQQIQQKRIKSKMNIHRKNIDINANQIHNPIKRKIQENNEKNQKLEKTKQQIYKSVSKKKLNSSINMSKQQIQIIKNFRQNQLKPSELSNIKPLHNAYSKSPQKAFYNSINNNNKRDQNKLENYNGSGYKFLKNMDKSFQSIDKSIKNQKAQPVKINSPINNLNSQNNNSNRYSKKYIYLPSEEIQTNYQQKYLFQRKKHQDYYDRSEKDLNFNHFNDKNSRVEYRDQLMNSFETYQKSVYDPHQHFHDHFERIYYPQHFFRSKKQQPQIRFTPEKYDSINGKFGRRVVKKSKSPVKQNRNFKDPIIVPQLKLNQKSLGIGNISSQNIYHLRNQENNRREKSPLISQMYRKQIQDKNYNRSFNNDRDYQLDRSYFPVDPTINFAKSQENIQRRSPYKNYNYQKSEYDYNKFENQRRNRSPVIKKRKILSENPFQL